MIYVLEPIPNPGIFRCILIFIQNVVGWPGAGQQFTEGCLCGYHRVEGHGPMTTRCWHCHPEDPDVIDFDL